MKYPAIASSDFVTRVFSRVGLSAPRPIPGYPGGPLFSVRVVSLSWLVPILKRQVPQMIHKWIWNIGGMILTGENGRTRRKTTLSTTNSTWTALGSKTGLRDKNPTARRLCFIIAILSVVLLTESAGVTALYLRKTGCVGTRGTRLLKGGCEC
jgi:hypothetical protein